MTNLQGFDGNTYYVKTDLTGKKFTRWTVMGVAFRSNKGVLFWSCICSCGEERAVYDGNLKGGKTTSCGCLHKEIVTTHGVGNHPLYHTAFNIQQRTCNQNHTAYSRYGAVGRGLCKDWQGSEGLVHLISYIDGLEVPDGYSKYDERLTVDRMDNSIGYIQGNLKWSTRKEQQNNRGISKNNTSGITGVSFCEKRNSWLSHWVDEFGNKQHKSFSAKKYGYEEARSLAIEARKCGLSFLEDQQFQKRNEIVPHT